MIVEYIRYKIPSEQQAAFESAYIEAQKSLNTSSHCLGWEVAHCVENTNHYVVRLLRDSVEGHINGFRQSSEFQAFYVAVQPFVANIEEMQHYELSRIQNMKQQ